MCGLCKTGKNQKHLGKYRPKAVDLRKQKTTDYPDWIGYEFEYDVWESQMEHIVFATQTLDKRGLSRLWDFLDTEKLGFLYTEENLSRLVYSMFCVYVKVCNVYNVCKYSFTVYDVQVL